ncbi:MAG TPA: YIP1 family protein [Dehalococcoidia bacterium]|jgi:hypothetical protein|nr:YIP1 family protein [Dehalococcoidia bacterium]
MDPNVVIERLKRLAKLDSAVFDEVRDDPQELVPSLIVAAVSCILAGVGAFLWWKVMWDFSDPDSLVVNTIVLGSVFLFVALYVGAVVAWVAMAQIYKVEADLQVVLRTVGYGAAPLALSIFMFIPVVWPVFSLVPLGLLFVMMIYALQSSTNADSRQVVLSTAIGYAAFVAVAGIVATQFADPGDAPIGAGQFAVLFEY